jgi:formylglycine-generating enzyme required for sulfatase activity/dienelactone hydrolase
VTVALEPGSDLAHYRLVEKLGEGGMGVVWRAHDSALDRDVALKVLPERVAGRPERLSRFQREARAVAALNHPNIVTIHSVEESGGVHFLTMELIAGETLNRRIPDGGMPLPVFFEVALPLIEALEAAHGHGIVHRDVKAANVMVTAEGRVKVLDFGLARIEADETTDASSATVTSTQVGMVLGTPSYMAPEQAEGKPTDARSDLFSAGTLFYEMLTGARPFDRGSSAGTMAAILHETPDPAASRRKDLPGDLVAIVDRCLAKDPARRYADAGELLRALRACRQRHLEPAVGLAAVLRRPAVALSLLAVVGALVALGVWWSRGSARERRVHRELVPEIEALIDADRPVESYLAAQEAARVLPDDPTVKRLVELTSLPFGVTSDPQGARVTFRPYRDTDGGWIEIGVTPITDARVPFSYLLVRVEKDGYDPRIHAKGPFADLQVKLEPAGTSPEGMTRIPDGEFAAGRAEPLALPAYWIDTYEVTNRQFQQFVDAGGYREPEHWQHPIVDGERTLSFDEAMQRFVDRTGRPGPSTWELGRHPDGEEEHPVGGVSWYEAAAYAAWAGKSLPSVYHWRHAAGITIFGDIIPLSNFGGEGPAPAGSHHGLSPHGTYDMAGNLKEWCHNRFGNQRYILGGAWDEASYRFDENDARDPLDREANFGFRCVRYLEPPSEEALAPVSAVRYDFRQVEPVPDEIFEVFAAMYDYPAAPLEARVEETDDTPRHWTRESVSFTPGYDGERMLVHLFLPRNASPPYQTVVLRPGGAVNWIPRVEEWISLMPAYIPRSARLLVVPALYGTLERRPASQAGITSSDRERFSRQVMDLKRTVDYLETREDIDFERLAYVGISAGAEYGPAYLAMETRFVTAILIAGGFHDEHMLGEPREINPWHYAPRVTTPTLMINGDADFTVPVETAQKPMFDLLGTAPEHKRHVVLEGGHVTSDQTGIIREVLAWLDRYQGSVEGADRPD